MYFGSRRGNCTFVLSLIQKNMEWMYIGGGEKRNTNM
jgi:hypothetical protein